MATAQWLQELMPSAAHGLLSDFASPPLSDRPMLRWWWPHGLVDVDELRHEIDEMHAAGFGGAEIQDVHFSVEVVMDPEGHGWGTEAWTNAVLSASEYAEILDFEIDIALGPTYPAANPGITPDSEGAEKEVATGHAVVSDGQTYSGSVPPATAAAAGGVTNQTLIALQALRMNTTSSVSAVPVLLDQDTLINLHYNVGSGSFTFVPPDNGTWFIISYWMRGTGQVAEGGVHTDPPSYVIDHVSVAGINSMTRFWDEQIFSPRLKSVFKKIGGSFFEDSLELQYNTLWTPKLRDEFRSRTGYDLWPYLPAIAQEDQKSIFELSDSNLNRGVINDFWDVMGALYVDYHIGTLKPWAHELGMTVRAQVYGLPTPATSASGALDISEGETLGFKNLGDYRTIAGVTNMKGQSLFSNEACAMAGEAYMLTWELFLQTLNPVFTTGNNHQVVHGFSYIEAPTAEWPGFAAWTPYNGDIGYAESWGPRNPLWKHVTDITGYMTRMQYILRKGLPKVDVVFFEQKGYIGAGYNSPFWADTAVMQGWSLNIIGADMLNYESAFVRDGRLAPDGPAYTVLSFETDSFASMIPVMQVNAAKKILEFAQDGLPIFAVGNWTSPGFYGWSEHEETGTLKAIFDRLLALPHVINVATREDMADNVHLLPVGPRVKLINGTQIINHHRVDEDIDYYLLVAASPATYAVSTKTKVYDAGGPIILSRQSKQSVPVLMDLWTGEVTPIAQYEELSESEIRVHVYIKAYSSMMIALIPLQKAPIYVARSNAVSVRRDGSGLHVRVNTTGSYNAKLSNGKHFKTQVDDIPNVQEIKGWDLEVQEWKPTSNINSSNTVYNTHKINNIGTLAPWTNYTQLQNVSGVGWYTANFILDKWPSNAGAVLDIPYFVGSFRITLNGVMLPPQDQLNNEFDVGLWLKAGENQLEIEVATTLLNRLRVTDSAVYGIAEPQKYGLVSPIQLKPYIEVKIPGA